MSTVAQPLTGRIPPPPPGFTPEVAQPGQPPPPPPGFTPEGKPPADETGIWAGIKRNTVGAAQGLFHAVTDPATEEEQQHFKDMAAKEGAPPHEPSKPELAYHRLVQAPADAVSAEGSKYLDAGKQDLGKGNFWKGINEYASGGANKALSAIPLAGPFINSVAKRAESGDVSGAATDVGAALLAENAPKIAKPIAAKVSDFAKENPAVAAQRALRPPVKGAIRTQQNVETARPFLKGAENLADLQVRVKEAKAEIWKPYSDAIERVGPNKVKGPDGPTTVAHLEQERLKTSADLQAVRKMNPTDQQTVFQKQSSIADLMERDRAIKAVLDPELQKAGIDPETIRKTHGAVKGVEKLVEGRNTLTEVAKPFGLGRIKNVNLLHPVTSLGQIPAAIKDIAANRPVFSGKPTDLAVKEGFRTGGEKPSFAAKPIMAKPPTTPSAPPTGFKGGINTQGATASTSPMSAERSVQSLSSEIDTMKTKLRNAADAPEAERESLRKQIEDYQGRLKDLRKPKQAVPLSGNAS